MFIKTSFYQQSDSDGDEDCSCSSCECPNCLSVNNNHPSITDQQRSSPADLNSIYQRIDQSYSKLPILYHSIKQTKLDSDFILSVNNYLDRLKSNIYKDLIRRETLLRNGKNHTLNLISLIRCITKISYEQTLEISNDSMTSNHTILYTMTAIDYILQTNFPQKKPLFNYILNEFISMWLHENLRIIQEDFSILLENGNKHNIFSLCVCLFQKLESICAINWERLQMMQNYRLAHFNQLIKPTSFKLETNQDFISLFGKPLKSAMKKSEIPITSLYSNRTDNELKNIDEIHQIFRKCIAEILLEQSDNSTKLINKDILQSPAEEKPTWNIISETHTQSIEPELLPRIPSSSENQFQMSSSSIPESKFIVPSIEMTPEQIHQSSSQNDSLISHSKTSTNPNESPTNQHFESLSNASIPIIPTLHGTSTTQDINNIIPSKSVQEDNSSINISSMSNFSSPQKPFPDDHLLPSSHQTLSDQNVTIDSKTILDSEINTLINFLTQLAHSSLTFQQEKETPSLLNQLESSLKETNTDPNSIIEKIRNTHPQPSLSVEDPLFLAAFTRVLRQELEDAQVLRKIDRGELNEESQNIGYLSFETNNILKLPNTSLKNKNTAAGDNIEQNHVFIEVTHDPSRCSPNHKLSYHHYPPATQHQRYSASQSTDTILSSPELNNQQKSSAEFEHLKQRWYWIRSNESPSYKDCMTTPDSLFCAPKSSDKNTYSITVEHNDEFQ